MYKRLSLFLLINLISFSLFSQLAVMKKVGKNSKNSGIGFGSFVHWDIPLNEIGNRSARIDLVDFGFFPTKVDNIGTTLGNVSIKAGYRYIFSSETRKGIYLEPQVGYCRVIIDSYPEATYGNGIALALAGGYTFEVGARGNSFDSGLKFESDRAGKGKTIDAIAFRMSYSFRLVQRKGWD